MTNKTKSKTYNFLSENKSIEDIKNQPNTTLKEKSRHGGKTFKLIEKKYANHQPVNDDISENEIFYDALDNIDTEKISKLQSIIEEKDIDIEQLKKQIEELKHSNKSELNLKKYTYNAITIYDKKQRKNTGIEEIHEEILSINNEIYFITTFVHTNLSITENILYFHNFNNGDIEIITQKKQYENIKKYKDDFSLIESNSNAEINIKVEPVSIKEFLSEQEKLSNWKISKSEWIIFISLSLLSITLLAIPVAVPALVPIISTILWEKTLISIVGIGIAWIVNKGIWNIATEKTKKVEVWIKQNFYSLIRKIPFVNKRNLGKTKE
ncbi:MAG: hypothetical protein H9Q65_05955, partial [Spiroplasma ixodetis]|nr:hypothetical protein [Spiroplasma ixodetis]